MTGSLVYLGPQPERAAAFKLFGNLDLPLPPCPNLEVRVARLVDHNGLSCIAGAPAIRFGEVSRRHAANNAVRRTSL
jgi:hypothetical protein